jgi:hypothetical protein
MNLVILSGAGNLQKAASKHLDSNGLGKVTMLWRLQPQREVLSKIQSCFKFFYNQRRKQLKVVLPNQGHL